MLQSLEVYLPSYCYFVFAAVAAVVVVVNQNITSKDA